MPVAAHAQSGCDALAYVRSYVEADVAPAVILRAFTTEAARLLGVDEVRGSIAAGMYADLIAVAGNPLEDPMALTRVRFVMKDGRVVVRR